MRFAALTLIGHLFLTSSVFPFKTKNSGNAAKCRVPTVKTAYNESKAVFVGEITGVVEDGDMKTFTFKVRKSWKGKANREIKVSVRETARYQAWFEVGEKYLVYARGGDENEKLWEIRCSRTKLLANASEDIKELGRAKKARK